MTQKQLQVDPVALAAAAAKFRAIADADRTAATSVANGTVSGTEFGPSSSANKVKLDWNDAVGARKAELLRMATISDLIAESLTEIAETYEKTDAELAEAWEFYQNTKSVISLITTGRPTNLHDILIIISNIWELSD